MRDIMYKVVLLPITPNTKITTLGYFCNREGAEDYIKYSILEDFFYYNTFRSDAIPKENNYRIKEVVVEIEEIAEITEDNYE